MMKDRASGANIVVLVVAAVLLVCAAFGTRAMFDLSAKNQLHLISRMEELELAADVGYVNISTVLHIPFFIFMRHLSLPRFSL